MKEGLKGEEVKRKGREIKVKNEGRENRQKLIKKIRERNLVKEIRNQRRRLVGNVVGNKER